MNTKIDTMALKQSFSDLKRTALDFDDIASWFSQNTACLPNVPLELVPHIVTRLAGTECFVGLSLKGDHVEGKAVIIYDTQMPDELPVSVTADELVEMLGHDVRVKTKSQTRAAAYGSLSLYLHPKEWNFVAALAAWDALHEDDYGSKGFFEVRTIEMWTEVFPNISWELVEQMMRNGLLPEDRSAFVAWACSSNTKKIDSPALPTNMTP